MENPRDCPSEIYKIMQDCWQEGPDKRPKFDQISQSIGTILEQRASQVRPFCTVFEAKEELREQESILSLVRTYCTLGPSKEKMKFIKRGYSLECIYPLF